MQFTIGIIGNLIAALIGFFGREIWRWRKGRKGPLKGKWRQIIEEGRHREDLVVCRHVGDELTGSIRRGSPEEEHDRRWKFYGRKKDNFVYLLFWNLDDTKNPESSGTIQLHVSVDGKRMEGFYVKSVTKPQTDPEALVRKLATTHLVWQRE